MKGTGSRYVAQRKPTLLGTVIAGLGALLLAGSGGPGARGWGGGRRLDAGDAYANEVRHALSDGDYEPTIALLFRLFDEYEA